MITKYQMLPLLVEACPSFLPIWKEMQREERQDEPLVYIELARFATHIVELQISGLLKEFESVFALIESFHAEGDKYVQEAVVVGLLEDIQTIAGNSGLEPDVFVPYLHPVSVAWWVSLNRFWLGESDAVAIDGTGSA